MIAQNYLKEIFEYKNGNLFWKLQKSNRVKTGDKCGSINSSGYLNAKLDGKKYLIHRLIFLYHHGFLPKIVDHIDNNILNNKIENLREANDSQSASNIKMPKTNSSGIKGISFDKKTKKWHVQLSVNNKKMYFGQYFDKNVAKFVSDTMRYKYHKEFANNG